MSGPAPTPDAFRNGHAPDFDALARTYAANLGHAEREDLAESLRLPIDALDALPQLGCYVDQLGDFCWTLPECDGSGRIVGLNRRYRNGDKRAILHSSRGLTKPEGWREKSGPVLMPEGASDVLAATAAGLAAIGRPSNNFGAAQLAELLRDVPKDRKLIVVGENDCKKDGTWPGRDGAIKTAEELSRKLGRRVLWSMTPDGKKDVRCWLDGLMSDQQSATWPDAGRQLLEKLTRTAKPATADDAKPVWEPAPMSAADMAARDWRTTWRVKRILVTDEPGIVFGPSKILKTSVVMDMVIALASGGLFLGEFLVGAPARVLFVSGESGGAALWRIANRVCEARGISLADLGDKLHVECSIPPLWHPEARFALTELVRKLNAELVVIDPVYLTLAGGDGGADAAKNLFAMGAQLGPLTEACREAGAQLLLIHHTNASLKIGETPDLAHIAFAGFQQFARQWIGLNRLTEYQHDGHHEMVMVAGGSAGHGGRWHMAIDEGQLDDDFGGRRWDVTVTAAGEAIQVKRDQKGREKTEQRQRQDRDDETAVLKALDRCLKHSPEGAAKKRISNLSGVSRPRTDAALARLLDCGTICEAKQEIKTGKGNKVTRLVDVLRRSETTVVSVPDCGVTPQSQHHSTTLGD